MTGRRRQAVAQRYEGRRSALPMDGRARNRTRGDAYLIFYATVLLLAVAAVWLFNRLVRLRNQVRNAWSDVDVQLQRRHDLVPMLVESVKGYADHERQLLECIASERSVAMRGGSPAQRIAPERSASIWGGWSRWARFIRTSRPAATSASSRTSW
jgi:hypothetical protein